MERLPKVIASSVVRSAHQGESHGGLYFVDLETGASEQVLDYNDTSIDWEGRGADRGLRGIAFYEGEMYLAASDEIFVYSRDIHFVRSIRGKFLKHCHEIQVVGDTLYVTSTGFDSVLEYDLSTRSFVRGYRVNFRGLTRRRNMMGFREQFNFTPVPRLTVFDPNSGEGPDLGNTCHVNKVFVEDGIVYVSGTRCAHLLAINGSKLSSHARIPFGTHNTRPFEGGVLMNDTRHDRVSYHEGGREAVSVPVKRYDERELLNSHLPRDNARQAFGRGLCLLGGGLVAAGSSPSTISVYDLNAAKVLKTINLSMDVRNSVHGLEVWPF